MKYQIVKPRHRRFKVKRYKRKTRTGSKAIKYKRTTVVKREEFLDKFMQLRGTKITKLKKPVLKKVK